MNPVINDVALELFVKLLNEDLRNAKALNLRERYPHIIGVAYAARIFSHTMQQLDSGFSEHEFFARLNLPDEASCMVMEDEWRSGFAVTQPTPTSEEVLNHALDLGEKLP